MDAKVDYPDRRVAVLAARQHGVMTLAQLTACGVSRNAVRRRAEAGKLLRIHRGVYAVGHRPPSWEARWMAAVLASGAGAVLSGAGAAALWGLLRPVAGPVEISVPTQAGRRAHAGIRLRRRRALSAAERTRHRAIPVTTVERTLADLPGRVSPRLVRRAIRQAELFHRFRAPGGDRTRSDLELEFLRFCRRRGLPLPEVNVRIERWTVNFLWRRARLVVETDDYRYHRGSVAFEDDHQRDLHLRRLGFAIRRYTGAQLRRHPAEIAAELGEILSDRPRPS
jgi:very-short-patch-repair endonuclease